METTDLFGRTGRVEAGKGGKPRLVFGETPPPARRESTYQRPDQTPTTTAPTPASSADPAPVAPPTPAGKESAARPAVEKRQAVAPSPSAAKPSPQHQYQRACAQAALAFIERSRSRQRAEERP